MRLAFVAVVLVGTLALAQLYAPAPEPAPAPQPQPSKPWVMAHRGGAAEAPENTLVAFERAVALGVHWLELDVQASADGALVVIHDATLDRTTDCEGPVNARTVVDLKECNACAAHCATHPFVPLSTFDEVLAHYANGTVRINVEIKNAPTEPHAFDPADVVLLPAVVDAIRAHPEYLPDRVLVSSFNFRTTTELKRVAPEIPVALLTLNPADAHAEAAFSSATSLDAVQPSKDGMRRETAARFVQDAHALGLQVHAWTVDDAPTMRALADAGVDGMITNRLTLMLSTFR